MRYLHASSDNYEDFASGRVLHHAPGLTNFPVRLAQEIFMRAASRLPTASPVCLYDGCCGSGYLLTVLGLLNQAKIHRIIGRDINQQAIEVAKRNLSLLSHKGLAQRRLEIERHLSEFRRPSYQQALASLDRIAGQLIGPEIEIDLDRGDLFDPQPLQWPPDIVFMDLPYGRLTAWQTDQSTQIRSNDQDNLSVALLLQSLSRQISRQGKAQMNGVLQPFFDVLVITTNGRLEGRNHIADDIFGRVMQKCCQPFLWTGLGLGGAENSFDQQRMLRHRKSMIAICLPVPARNAGKPMGDVLNLDIKR